MTTLLSFSAAGTVLIWGWMHRQLSYLSPEEGLGYALGIVGGSLMLILALYPARKHLGAMRRLGATRHWFRMHMVFGIAGPIAILFHCNFSTGAPNSNAALYAMLIVSSSGLFGRYLYAHIHQGLYGRHIELEELRRSWLAARNRAEIHAAHVEVIDARVRAFEEPLAAMRRTLIQGLARLLVATWQRQRILALARGEFDHRAELSAEQRQTALTDLRDRLAAAAAVYRANAFERLFSLWHLLHLPLYLLLIVTGIVHVVAVNMY
jgi:hypothetical protein